MTVQLGRKRALQQSAWEALYGLKRNDDKYYMVDPHTVRERDTSLDSLRFQ